jgi:hypothetical protein
LLLLLRYGDGLLGLTDPAISGASAPDAGQNPADVMSLPQCRFPPRNLHLLRESRVPEETLARKLLSNSQPFFSIKMHTTKSENLRIFAFFTRN